MKAFYLIIICFSISFLNARDVKKTNVTNFSEYREVMNSFPGVYICWKDRDSIYRGANENFAALLGKKPEELVGVQDIICPHVRFDQMVLRTGKSVNNIHETITTYQGVTLNILTQKGPWYNERGEIVGVVVCFIIDPTR